MRHTGNLLATAMLGMVILAGAPRAVAAGQWADPDVPRITLAELKKLVDQDAVIVLDVRGDEAYRSGHFPGALSLPLESVSARAAEWKNARKPIVTYCS